MTSAAAARSASRARPRRSCDGDEQGVPVGRDQRASAAGSAGGRPSGPACTGSGRASTSGNAWSSAGDTLDLRPHGGVGRGRRGRAAGAVVPPGADPPSSCCPSGPRCSPAARRRAAAGRTGPRRTRRTRRRGRARRGRPRRPRSERGAGDQAAEGGEHADSLPGVSDLFSTALRTTTDPGAGGPGGGAGAPLAVRMRPGPRRGRRAGPPAHAGLAAAPPRGGGGRPAGAVSVVLWGPPGTGKTTLAHVLSRPTERRFVELNAVSAGVKDVRARLDEARDARARLYRREHRAVPRRDPPLQQVPAGLAAHRRREPLGQCSSRRPPRTPLQRGLARCSRARWCSRSAAGRRRPSACSSTGRSTDARGLGGASPLDRRGRASTSCARPPATRGPR